MPRLNPFPFPSDTGLRFGLLLVFILCGSFGLYGDLWQVFHVSGDQAANACTSRAFSQMLSSEKGIDPQSQSSANKFAEETIREISHCSQLLEPKVKWQIGGVLLTIGLSLVIYWFFPALKIWRERLLPLSAEDLPELATELKALCEKARLSPCPSFVWNPLKIDLPSAFGRCRRYYVTLSGGFIIRFFYSDRDAFRAIILHELAHIRSADVDKTYFTIASSIAFVPVVLAPAAAVLFWPGLSLRFASDILFQILSSTALIVLSGLAVLRGREYYADVRASVWDGTLANLDRVLNAFPPPKPSRWRKVFQFHPSPTERQQTLRDTCSLFHLSFWDAFGIGIACSVAVDTVQGASFLMFAPHASQLQAFKLLYLAVELGVPLCFMLIAVGVVGIAVWKETFARLTRGQRKYDTGRLGLALGLGYVFSNVASAVLFTTDKAFRPSAAPMLAFAVYGSGILLIALFLIFRWLAATVSAWLELTLQDSSPLPTLITSIAAAIGLVVAWIGVGAFTSILLVLYRKQLSIYFYILTFGSAICLSSAIAWAFPLVAWFWRKRATSAPPSTWAFLDGEFDVPKQLPLRPDLAMKIGVGASLIFCLALASVRFGFHLPSHTVKSIEEAYGGDMVGLIILAPAAILQAVAAAFAAGRIARLGALHGAFAAFVAGFGMVIGDHLLVGIHQSLNEALWTSVGILGLGTLCSLPIALAVAGIAASTRRSRSG
jgi:Zn-dependent protease with chaperone function